MYVHVVWGKCQWYSYERCVEGLMLIEAVGYKNSEPSVGFKSL